MMFFSESEIAGVVAFSSRRWRLGRLEEHKRNYLVEHQIR